MNTEALQRFHYWIRERHTIHLKRLAGEPKPWTNDPILQNNFFTNPYRENDKTTAWFRRNVRDPLKNKPEVILATTIFRWFNLIATGELLLNHQLLRVWNPKKALAVLGAERDAGRAVFTGAFMINSPAGKPKLEAIIDRINNVWRDRHKLKDEIDGASMQAAHKVLLRYPGLGGFMAYEIVCDLRYTYLLRNAPDKSLWCNPGPGAVRGLYRLLGRPFPKGNNATSPPVPKDWALQTQRLLKLTRAALSDLPKMEMREIEMSLCEIDKYERIRLGDGKSKRKYNGQ